MLNFGLTEMRLVSPRDGWPNPDAGPAASGADMVLEAGAGLRQRRRCGRRLLDDLRLDRPPPRPRHAGGRSRSRWPRRSHRHPARSAILFGPERSGLETEDVAIASHIVTVPINPEFGSLNLAQAVILLAYEWSKQRRSCPAARQGGRAARPPCRTGRADRAGRCRARRGRLFPPARTDAGDQEHAPHDLHQGRLVVARGQGGARRDPRADRLDASANAE